MINTKGQQFSIATLLAIVVGVAVVVIVILGFTGTFDFIFEKKDVLPGQQLQAIVESCKVAAGSSLTIDYCGDIKKESDDRYVTCTFGIVKDNLGISEADLPKCNSASMKSLVTENCAVVAGRNKDITINNVYVKDAGACGGGSIAEDIIAGTNTVADAAKAEAAASSEDKPEEKKEEEKKEKEEKKK